MPVCSAAPVELTASERHRLKKMAYGHKTPHQARQLLAARGRANARIVAETRLHVDTVRRWRGRFAAGRVPALADLKRSGRPPTFTALQIAEVKSLACQLPTESGIPLSRWSCPELAREAVTRASTEKISASTVRRWLKDDALKPWQHRSWIFIRDLNFRATAQRILDLYGRVFEGAPLGDDEYVISADEKTSIQARCRCHPTLAPGQTRAMRVYHTYGRGGALAYLAAYDIHRAEVFGRCEQTTGIVPFMKLVEQVMTIEPYASAKRVYWIVDNGSSHRGKSAIDRMASRFPNAVMVHTPVHASWLNQIEIFFSIVQRKVVSPNDFTNLDEVRDRLRAFEDRYNATAQPFQWKFTTTDLDDLLASFDRHTLTDRQERSSTALAA
ncbi:IS630 family transposase [Streptomyces clavifer]|uniref:IS630 family transposase n=1 Tax=Streptomyces clavifer TaxID=68188 RepID=UPI00308B3C74|nr:IS630 family transposase [Streptomyces clavifer]WRY86370.1 IS630 family transposase [Streptomyces clavifer]